MYLLKAKVKSLDPRINSDTSLPLTMWLNKINLRMLGDRANWRPRLGQFLEIMTPSSTDFRERITGEITAFIQNQARAMSITAIERLVANLPALRKRFAKIPAQSYPYLADQLRIPSPAWDYWTTR